MNWEVNGPTPRKYVAILDGIKFEANSHLQIFARYENWKKQKGERLSLEWEDDVWKALSQSHPNHVKRIPAKKSPGVSVASASSFIAYVIRQMGRKRKLVDVAEAKRRAAICFNCPKKEPVLGCSVCKQALKLFVKPPEKVDAPPACGACGCWLPLKIWIMRDHLGSADEWDYDVNCWMRQ